MRHEVEAIFKNGKTEQHSVDLVEYGIPNGYTAMAKTVGYPCAIAARMLLLGMLSIIFYYTWLTQHFEYCRWHLVENIRCVAILASTLLQSRSCWSVVYQCHKLTIFYCILGSVLGYRMILNIRRTKIWKINLCRRWIWMNEWNEYKPQRMTSEYSFTPLYVTECSSTAFLMIICWRKVSPCFH